MILTLKQFSVEVGAKYGTVKRWVHEGMPVIRNGHEKKSKGGTARVRIDLSVGQAWLEEKRRNQRMGPKHGANRRTVILFAHDTDRDWIKIGFSSDPEARMRDFRKRREGAHHNVKLVGTTPGDMLVERASMECSPTCAWRGSGSGRSLSSGSSSSPCARS